MVWEIAFLYYQRPSVRDLLNLYANVASTAFVAGELQDLDLLEQMEPVVTTALGGLVGAVPGMTAFAVLFVNSVTNGGANAFLTLRVGMIARR